MNTYIKKGSKGDTKSGERKSRLLYPSWKSLTQMCVKMARLQNPDMISETCRFGEGIFERIDLLKEAIVDTNLNNLIMFLSKANAGYKSNLDFESVMKRFNQVSVRPNEFYAVFDFEKFNYCTVDEKVRTILGIAPEDFNIPAMAGMIADNPLFHKRDKNHILRWTCIAYYVLSIDLFNWESLEDQYRIRFRVGTSMSSNSFVKSQNYVTLEKLAFLFCECIDKGPSRPTYHFDKYLVFDETEFDTVRPQWLGKPERQIHINNFNYLLHAYLLGIAPQFLLLLHESMNQDRNKLVALSMNRKIKQYTGIQSVIDEHQVANCFAKTIRSKVSQAINVFDKREVLDLEYITNEPQAVQVCKTLGLLPIPQQVLKMLYSNITEI